MTPSSWPTLDEIISEISSAQGAIHKIVAGPVRGGSNCVYKTQSEDGSSWCLRIPLDADAGRRSARGVALLKSLKEEDPGLLAPAVIYPTERYTLMEYLDGEALKSWNTRSLTQERRQMLLDDLATFLFSVWTCQAQVPRDESELRFKNIIKVTY
jgi:aminoglycoside phosphotransferase (APT) family kinase protein